MNCSKIQSLLSAYMDGELPGHEQLQIRRHLSDCQSCAAEHESLLTTKRMISSLSVRQPTKDLEQMILEALAEEESSRKRRSPILAWWLTLPLNRRLQFASLFAIGAVALAAGRIVPILMAPPKAQPSAQYVIQTAPQPTFGPEASPVRELSFIHNPTEDAPVSTNNILRRGPSGATPVSITEFTGSGSQ